MIFKKKKEKNENHVETATYKLKHAPNYNFKGYKRTSLATYDERTQADLQRLADRDLRGEEIKVVEGRILTTIPETKVLNLYVGDLRIGSIYEEEAQDIYAAVTQNKIENVVIKIRLDGYVYRVYMYVK